jgi:chemotaxis protein MotB
VRTLRVQGLAASKLLDPKQPESPINRRISIIVMNRDAEDAVLKNLPQEDPAPAPAEAEVENSPSSSATKPR